MAMVFPQIEEYKQDETENESAVVFFHRLATALETKEDGYAFSLDLIIREDELYYEQAVLRREFFDTYLKQMALILPALMSYFVFVKGGNANMITMAIDELAGELIVTNPRFSGRDDQHRLDFELLVGMIYTQSIIAKHNEYKWSLGTIDTHPRGSGTVKTITKGESMIVSVEVGESIPFFETPIYPAPFL